jgi:NTP pyrophosphatase (non-canonical NTP hydrolase)
VLDVYQTLQKIAKRTNDEIYERGSRLTEVERKEKKAQAQKYMKLSDELGDILEKVGDKNGIEMLKNARASWREYASLYGNPIFQSLEKHHALPVDTISKLDVGTSGNELLNRIVAKRPDLRENIFAQKYSSPKSHGELLRPSKLNDKYLKELPDVKSFVESLKNAAENKKEVKATGFELKAEHKELADAISKEAEQQKLRQEAVANVKNYRELAAKKTKAAELVKKKVSQAKARGENIDALEAQLKDLQSQREKIKRLLNTALKAVYRYGGIKSALGH